MNTTQDPIPLFGDDESETASETSTSSQTPNEIESDPPADEPVAADRSDSEEPALDDDSTADETADAQPSESEVASSAVDTTAQAASGGAEASGGNAGAAATPTPEVPGQAPRMGSDADVDAWLAQSPDSTQPTSAWVPTDEAADAAMAAWIAADPNAPIAEEGPVVVGPGGKIERQRAPRDPLVPRWLPWVLLAVLAVGGIAAGSAALISARARVIVPTVAGLTTQVARERVSSVGLVLTVTDRRFSTLPVDTILSQTPDAGSTTTRGSAVIVVVSGGTEEFTMPDLVGQGLSLARSQLEQKGLQVQVDTQASTQPSDTVLATNPAAGSPMHTGDVVRLTVAASSSGASTPGSSTPVPFALTGVRITIDPSAPVAGQPDAALEVARRLQSLFEASGAIVLPTRTSADTGTAISVTARQARARENTPTVAIGLDVVSSGIAGVVVTYPSSSIATASAASSLMLASQITSGFAGGGLNARQTAAGSDVVLAGTTAPYSRITLGTTGSLDDLANFRDTNWADKVARAIYQGVGSLYGTRNPNGAL